MQGIQAFPGIGPAHLGAAAAVFQAKELDEELDVDDAAEAAFEIAVAACGLDTLTHVRDLIGQLRFPYDSIGSLGKSRLHLLAEFGIPANHARPRQRLA